MTNQNPNSRVWDLIEKARIGMLTTRFADGLRARPLEARGDRDAGIIWFLTDVRGAKDDEIDAAHEVGLTFIDEDSRAYLSITGSAFVTRDAAKAEEIWRKTDDICCPAGRAIRMSECFALSRSRPNYGTVRRSLRARLSNSTRRD